MWCAVARRILSRRVLAVLAVEVTGTVHLAGAVSVGIRSTAGLGVRAPSRVLPPRRRATRGVIVVAGDPAEDGSTAGRRTVLAALDRDEQAAVEQAEARRHRALLDRRRLLRAAERARPAGVT